MGARIALSLVVQILVFGMLSCGKPDYHHSLPDARELGSPRGYRIARTITHIHTPYSYDACDKAGLSGSQPNQECLNHLRYAFCENRIDFAFATDHANHMGRFEVPELLLKQPGDQFLVDESNKPYANRIRGCANGFSPIMMAGLEGPLLALGMRSHISGTPDERVDIYSHDDVVVKDRIKNETKALVGVVHTEQWTEERLETLVPDFIEIYNIHANIDPKMREKYLGLPALDHIGSVLSFMIDPYGELNADFMFMHFFHLGQVYFERWAGLFKNGHKTPGIGATDSHENAFPQKSSDGERLDAHRRLVRFMSNHVLVHDVTPDEIIGAIQTGRSWVVFEGFGSPMGFDLSASVGGVVIGVGDSKSLSGGNAKITVNAPALHRSSPRGDKSPLIRMELKRVSADGAETIVAKAAGQSIVFDTNAPGAYRAEVYITPKHLEPFLTSFSDYAYKEYRWIVTNHLYLDP